MKNQTNTRTYFFVGIGGIGMSALAQLLHAHGHAVSGVDRDESPTTALLREKGITVSIGHAPIPVATDILVYSDAVPPENQERTEATSRMIPQYSYFEMLGEVSAAINTIAVAGTHGKTTTTGMLARILRDGGVHPTAVIGSIVRDFGSNFLAGKDDLFVVEACEYKNHLLHLNPNVLVLTNIELDHTDFFPSLAAMQESFRTAVEKVPAHGAIITDPHSKTIRPVLATVRAQIIDYTQESVGTLRLIGDFNQANAKAAKAAATYIAPSLAASDIDASLAAFEGSWRRFEYKGVSHTGAQVYDDYAHHPTAIEKTIRATKERFEGKRVVVVFHPHLYSRTRDLFEGFVTALATADRLILAPIYAAREIDQGDISSEILRDAILPLQSHTLSFASFDDIYAHLIATTSAEDIIITMGAGDIYKVAEHLTK
jgi:UDP-N-acetylmuramate--alanine ligase